MPTQVVVPSVSRADLLQGTAGTITVEPSDASLPKPASDCGFSGLPGSGALAAVGTPGPEVTGAGACAQATGMQAALSSTVQATILNMAGSVS